MRLRKWQLCALILSMALGGCSKEKGGEANQTPAPNPPRQSPANDLASVKLPPDSPMLKRIKVEAIEARRLPLDEVVAPGKIEANPNRISRIAMPVAGRVKRVMVGIGDAVQQGQALLAIDSPEIGTAAANYRQAQARVSQTKAGLAKAEADLSRSQDLYSNRAIAQKEVLSAKAGLAQAKAELEQAEASSDEALRRLEIFGLKPGDSNQEILVRAPLSGKVLEISVAAGEYRNDTSAPLMTVADLSLVYMAADVPESQIRLVTVGERVEIALSAYPGEVFHGTVARIADTVDPQARTVKVRAELKNPSGRLRPDMFGEMRHEETFRTVPVAPPGAVVQSDKQSIVWRETGPGSFEPVVVKFGKQDENRVPILDGLKAGDRVVVDGAMLLRGSR